MAPYFTSTSDSHGTFTPDPNDFQTITIPIPRSPALTRPSPTRPLLTRPTPTRPTPTRPEVRSSPQIKERQSPIKEIR